MSGGQQVRLAIPSDHAPMRDFILSPLWLRWSVASRQRYFLLLLALSFATPG